ncbi:MAG: GH92 family glycosyl hydrolase [Bacteroidia bacterium]
MNSRHSLFCIGLALVLFSCKEGKEQDKSGVSGFVRYVDPFIGTGGHGHTFPGATLPFGMVQLSPDTRADGSWDGCGGYHYSDTTILGFSHTHLSGTGCSDYGDILLMPFTGTPSLDSRNYSSTFSHQYEKASPGYYAVRLNKSDIMVELTATLRAGFHKYIFPKAGTGNIVVDLYHRDKTLESHLEVLDKTHLEGMRRSQSWAKDQHIYFSLEFSKPFKTSILQGDAKEGSDEPGKDRGGVFSFETNAGDSILVKVGISTVSMEGARKNLRAEIPGWDFQKVSKDASKAWEEELGRIEVSGPDPDKLKIFYTALYHTMVQPNLNMDVDSSYRGRDNKIHKAKGFTYYSVFSLWDTFRGAHPLYTIIEQNRTNDFIQTFLAQYQQGGRLPVWELASNETDCMIGYHSVAVIADAAIKGLKGYDQKLALEAMQHSAMENRNGLATYRSQEYLSADDEAESVSRTLEYAYDDWCISEMAFLQDKHDIEKKFLHRSQYYRNVFDAGTGFMRPRCNGGWLEPFEPREVNNHYTEANAWQYTFFVLHDFPRLIDMMGGKAGFAHKLDSLFSTSSKTTGRDQADITGMIGQYAHGNEPSHHIAYLYNYCAQPWKTQDLVHCILTQFYKATPDGLIGNEDCGQMSAWYVLSAMGFYSVTPGSPAYSIGAPLFPEVRIHLENGKLFTVHAKNLSDENHYVQTCTSSHAPNDPLVLPHADIMNGESLNFEMGSKPCTECAGKSACKPLSGAGKVEDFIPAPIFNATSFLFREKEEVRIDEAKSGTEIHYTKDQSQPDQTDKAYTKPLVLSKTTTIKARAWNEKDSSIHSGISTGTFYKFPNWWTVKINSTYSPQYSGGGDEALIDGVHGDLNWRKGKWQGYQGQDFEAIIDLGSSQMISHVSAEFLQDENAWIIMPKEVEFFTSSDGKKFKHLVTVDHNIAENDERVQIRELGVDVRKQKTRYIKVKAMNYGRLPDWHPGAGGKAYIFIDEISIE